MLVKNSKDHQIAPPSEFIPKNELEEGGMIASNLYDSRIFLEPPETGYGLKKKSTYQLLWGL